MKVYHITLSTLILFGLSTSLGAQSAENFQLEDKSNNDVLQKSADVVQMQVIDKEAESELLASPSRYAGLDLDNYVQALSSSFSMRTRDLDPFARHQDPNFKPPQPVAPRPGISKPQPEPVTPFSDIIARINITAVVPAKQLFLVGERSFRVGDRIELDVGKEKPISVHVMAIEANSVNFRHGITGETANLSLGLTPEGMERGVALHPPGMVSKNSPAPLDARPDNPVSSRR
ncbi:hypothetical protein [Haloferula sp.]|uniref:hypothetical protein n=1 Tax=Haloferula sp. TaxID=2497595 RepID=UPI003C784F95